MNDEEEGCHPEQTKIPLHDKAKEAGKKNDDGVIRSWRNSLERER